LSLELLPSASQTMTREYLFKPIQIDRISLDELKHARFIFCPACFERDGGEVLESPPL